MTRRNKNKKTTKRIGKRAGKEQMFGGTVPGMMKSTQGMGKPTPGIQTSDMGKSVNGMGKPVPGMKF